MNAHDSSNANCGPASPTATGGRRFGCACVVVFSRGLSALIVAVSTAVALAVAVIALVVLHHGRPPSCTPPPATTTRHPGSARPRTPGRFLRNVDDAVVAAAWNTAWA